MMADLGTRNVTRAKNETSIGKDVTHIKYRRVGIGFLLITVNTLKVKRTANIKVLTVPKMPTPSPKDPSAKLKSQI
jgi:hypothetical protein